MILDAKEFRRFFDCVWRLRAKQAGWNLELIHAGKGCTFRLSASK